MSQARENISVLVVDDNATMRALLRAMLRGAGYLVVGEASDGKAALAMVDQMHPDIVVLDMQMSGMSGLEVLRELHGTMRNAAVVAVSAADDKGSVRQAFDLGALGYVTKPFNEERILAVFAQVAAILARWGTGGRAAGTDTASAKRTVIIDDSEEDRGLLGIILKNGGYTVAAEAESGMAGLTAVERERPDFVCHAVDLPEIDGLNVLSCLHAVHPNLPVIVVSAHTDRETVTRAIAGGVKGYIIKPFDPEKVLATVHHALAQSARQPGPVATGRDGSAHHSLQEPV